MNCICSWFSMHECHSNIENENKVRWLYMLKISWGPEFLLYWLSLTFTICCRCSRCCLLLSPWREPWGRWLSVTVPLPPSVRRGLVSTPRPASWIRLSPGSAPLPAPLSSPGFHMLDSCLVASSGGANRWETCGLMRFAANRNEVSPRWPHPRFRLRPGF